MLCPTVVLGCSGGQLIADDKQLSVSITGQFGAPWWRRISADCAVLYCVAVELYHSTIKT